MNTAPVDPITITHLAPGLLPAYVADWACAVPLLAPPMSSCPIHILYIVMMSLRTTSISLAAVIPRVSTRRPEDRFIFGVCRRCFQHINNTMTNCALILKWQEKPLTSCQEKVLHVFIVVKLLGHGTGWWREDANELTNMKIKNKCTNSGETKHLINKSESGFSVKLSFKVLKHLLPTETCRCHQY